MKPTVNMVGRLTRDVTNVFSNDDGTASRCLFTMACNSYYKAGDGSKKESVDFIPCIAWTGLVPPLTTWGKKGRQLHIDGTLEAFQGGPDENGKYPPTKIQVRVERFQFLDKKPEGVETPAKPSTENTVPGDFDMNKMAEMVAAKLLGATNSQNETNVNQANQAAAEAAAEQRASEGLDSVI